VQDSVAAHLVADVPVGIFLSGGIDSSAICRRRSAPAPPASTPTPCASTTVRRSTNTRGWSRPPSARPTTSSCSTRRAFVADLPRILRHLDQPTLDAVNGFYVSAAVAETGIKAVLSGTGGDELFGGYPSFRRLPAAFRLKRRLGRMAPAVGPAVSLMLPERLSERWQHFMAGNGRIDGAYRTQRGLFMPAELERLAGPALRDRWAPTAARVAAAESVLFGGAAPTLEGDVSRLETRVYLGSQLLRDLDVMSMAHGLEVRVPFVDHVLVDAVWPDLGRASGADAQQAAAARNAAPRAPARGRRPAEAGIHAAVQAVDRRRAAAVRAVGHGLPCRVGVDRARGA
jgi:asparagine synthase (glutamine-hydrolysing)